MNQRGTTVAGVVTALFLLGSAVVGVVALGAAIERMPRPDLRAADDVGQVALVAAGSPIRSEADVFRTRLEFLAIGDPGTPRRSANPRNLHSYRIRRAYPGAPPRIPHGLTTRESLTGACNNCHERGGYSPRFGAYVPVTPHPELEACLQCHVPDDATVGITLPDTDPNAICRQCHDPTSPGQAQAGTWATVWPRIVRPRPGDPPPAIPHTLQLRGNCLTCHGGPGAVAEIRTDHPERTNCRQCHVTGDDAVEPFSRPLSGPADPEGGR